MNIVINEKSCGIIAFHKRGRVLEFLLLHYPEGHWDLPKGHVEEGESEKETAVRELKEETGIENFIIIEDFREKIHYFFRRNHELVSKDVIFYLAEVKEKDINLSHEHQNFIWLPYEKAHKKLTFKNVKDILKKAYDLINA